jgi:hypothetical protein
MARAHTVEAAGAAVLLGGAAVAALSGTDERGVRIGPVAAGSLCPIHRLTGRRCPGCGMTRAMALLLRGKPLRATRTHAAAIPLLAALVHRVLTAVGPLRAKAVPA